MTILPILADTANGLGTIGGLLTGIFILILLILAIFMPAFVFGIYRNSKKQVDYLKAHLEAQNQIIKILWETKN